MTRKKRGRRLLTKLLLVVALLGSRAYAASVSVSPGSGPGNFLVTATASGFQPDVTGTNYGNTGFYVDGGLRAVCPYAPDAAYANCSVQLRAPVGNGPHVISAINAIGGIASNTYTVVTPTFSIRPACGPAGTKVTATGKNYPAAYNVGVFINGSYSGAGQLTDESGTFSIQFNMPGLGDGEHAISGRDSTGNDITNFFTITTNCIGTAYEIEGEPTVTRPDGTTVPLRPGTPIGLGDLIKTGAGGQATVEFIDNTQLTLSKNTKFRTDDYVFDPGSTTHNKARYNFAAGTFQFLSGLIGKKPDPNVAIETAYGAIGIRGTEFIVRKDPCSTTQEVYLIEGQLAIKLESTGVTNIIDGPATILFTATNISTSALNQATFDVISEELSQVDGVVTFPSWVTEYFGCTNEPAAAIHADSDGDGQDNFTEFLVGTNPTTNASSFRILSAVNLGGDIRVTWLGGGGRTNVLQSAPMLGGSWSNVSANIILPNSGDVITNYLDPGAVTNTVAKYYRVRLVQ